MTHRFRVLLERPDGIAQGAFLRVHLVIRDRMASHPSYESTRRRHHQRLQLAMHHHRAVWRGILRASARRGVCVDWRECW